MRCARFLSLSPSSSGGLVSMSYVAFSIPGVAGDRGQSSSKLSDDLRNLPDIFKCCEQGEPMTTVIKERMFTVYYHNRNYKESNLRFI